LCSEHRRRASPRRLLIRPLLPRFVGETPSHVLAQHFSRSPPQKFLFSLPAFATQSSSTLQFTVPIRRRKPLWERIFTSHVTSDDDPQHPLGGAICIRSDPGVGRARPYFIHLYPFKDKSGWSVAAQKSIQTSRSIERGSELTHFRSFANSLPIMLGSSLERRVLMHTLMMASSLEYLSLLVLTFDKLDSLTRF
jgi:hypothetical protein